MSATSETIPSLALNLLKEVKSKAKDDTTEVKSLDVACCLAEAAADITSEVPKITQGNADNDALDSARASVINADMTISATIEQSGDSETRERLGSIAGCLQRNVRKIKKDGAENKDAANGLVRAAIRLSGEAARIAGNEGAARPVSAATAATVRISGLAASVAAHASGIVSNTEGGAAEHANRIVTDAAKVAEEAANVPTQGDSDDVSHNVRVAAEISKKTTLLEDGAAKVAEEVGTQFEEPLRQSTLLGALPLGLFGKDTVNSIFAEMTNLFVDPNVALKTAGDILKSADDQAVRDFVFGVMTRSLCSFRGSLGNIPRLYEDVFKDGPNSDAVRYIVKEHSQLAEFLIDVIEPAKEFAVSTSADGTPRGSNARVLNEYNELNLHKSMNRYAVICTLQRFVKAIVSDVEGAEFQKGKEEWFFVNGISGEPFWVKAACNRIAEVFHREVIGVPNRSEGILWDMLECAGEQSRPGEGSNLVNSTESSRKAQNKLKDKLQAASGEQVVVIAHSQGCLLLRSVLQELQNDSADLLQSSVTQSIYTTKGRCGEAWNWKEGFCGGVPGHYLHQFVLEGTPLQCAIQL
ncbi:hypothetical protein BJX68DRAFT_263958 [Aspergillus pseudodeflectus]|uniref:Uncharacterized protein n=1 Tax=Aspergillus pseudodeflectus TaxID=176178 RepID=A0ABR4KUA0_9EURO